MKALSIDVTDISGEQTDMSKHTEAARSLVAAHASVEAAMGAIHAAREALGKAEIAYIETFKNDGITGNDQEYAYPRNLVVDNHVFLVEEEWYDCQIGRKVKLLPVERVE